MSACPARRHARTPPRRTRPVAERELSSAGPIGSEDSNGLIERDTAAARPSDFLIHALYHLHHSPGVLIFLGMGVQAEAVTFHLFDSFALFSLHPLHWTGVAMAERPML